MENTLGFNARPPLENSTSIATTITTGKRRPGRPSLPAEEKARRQAEQKIRYRHRDEARRRASLILQNRHAEEYASILQQELNHTSR